MRLFLIITYSIVTSAFMLGFLSSRRVSEQLVTSVCVLCACVLLYFAVNG